MDEAKCYWCYIWENKSESLQEFEKNGAISKYHYWSQRNDNKPKPGVKLGTTSLIFHKNSEKKVA